VLRLGRSLQRILRFRSLGSPLALALRASLAAKRPAAALHDPSPPGEVGAHHRGGGVGARGVHCRNLAELRGVHSCVHVRTVLAAAAALALLPVAALAIPQVGHPAPAFSLPSPDGKTITLDSLRGKPVYVNFFASWCGPCNAEAPSIGKLRAQYAKRGLQVVGIDELDAAGQAAAFEKKYGNPYALVAIDESGTVGKSYNAIAMPVHVFIDRHGNVTTYRLGEMSPAEIETAIQSALK
jgi:peroxiredoxin